MTAYRLEHEAETDLIEIGLYTARTWSPDQAERYLQALDAHFVAISQGTVLVRQVDEQHPDLFYSYCQHHYVFFAREPDSTVLILAIFHEKMDLMTRLAARLQQGGEA